MIRHTGIRHRRPSDEAVAGFVDCARASLSCRQGAAMLVAIAESRGVAWSIPREDRLWAGLARLARDHLSEADLARYRDALENRSAAGEPLVDPEKVRAIASRKVADLGRVARTKPVATRSADCRAVLTSGSKSRPVKRGTGPKRGMSETKRRTGIGSCVLERWHVLSTNARPAQRLRAYSCVISTMKLSEASSWTTS
jgi:hypothetical protein